jgi:hypothetical protein
LENSRQNALDSRKAAGQIEIGREEKTPAPFGKRNPVVQQCALTLQTALAQVGQELILLRCKGLKKIQAILFVYATIRETVICPFVENL